MTDYPTAYQVARLSRTVAYLASVVAINLAIINNNSYSSSSMLTLTTLRAATDINLTSGTIFLLADINGDPGVYYHDTLSSAADDGLTTIVDSSSRRWRRLEPIV